jgi:hypothetical protein
MEIHLRKWLFYLACAVIATQSTLHASDDPILIITPGTIVGNQQAASWNRVVLLATPSIASGDTAKLSDAIRAAISSLTLTILATVKSEPDEAGQTAFRLEEVGIGYSTAINNKLTIVSTDSASKLGAQLGFYGRQMLSENGKLLANVRLILRTTTLAVFDTPAIMLRDGQHKEFVTRHLLWLDPRTGKMAMAVWLLSSVDEGQLAVAEKKLRVVAAGTREDRKIHVDGRSFFLGIPTTRSFALEDLPPGADFAWTEAAKELAAKKAYHTKELDELANALNQMLGQR